MTVSLGPTSTYKTLAGALFQSPKALGYLETELFMAVLLTTHKALQGIQKLSFCYLCSRELSSPEAINRDHVPPSGLFAFADRDPPLILTDACGL
jgi:hypothetical protein